jgi:hypothetical protein
VTATRGLDVDHTIITVRQHPLTKSAVTPYYSGNHDNEQFLPSDRDAFIAELLGVRPRIHEPIAVEIASTSVGTSCVRIKAEFGGGRPVRFQNKRSAVPTWEKILPPLKISSSLC